MKTFFGPISALVPKAKVVLGNSSAISRTRFLYWAPWAMTMSKPLEAYCRAAEPASTGFIFSL